MSIHIDAPSILIPRGVRIYDNFDSDNDIVKLLSGTFRELGGALQEARMCARENWTQPSAMRSSAAQGTQQIWN